MRILYDAFGLASKVSVNSYGTEGGISGHSRPNLFSSSSSRRDVTNVPKNGGFPFLRLLLFCRVPLDLFFPTWLGQLRVEEVKWERGERDYRDLLLASVDSVEGDLMSTDNQILLQHHLSLSLSLALKKTRPPRVPLKQVYVCVREWVYKRERKKE
jgi:hypothetical protein